jgi:hypothetical protein
VGVAFAGGAIAQQRDGDRVLAGQSCRVREANRVQGVGRQRCALRSGAVQIRVETAVPITAQQGQYLDRVDAPADHRHAVSVRREQPVPFGHRGNRSDLTGLLASRGGIDRQPTLLGQRGGLGVETASDDHPTQQIDQHVRAGHCGVRRMVRSAVGLDQHPRLGGR